MLLADFSSYNSRNYALNCHDSSGQITFIFFIFIFIIIIF